MTSLPMKIRFAGASALGAAALFILLGAAHAPDTAATTVAEGMGRPSSLVAVGPSSVVLSGALAPGGSRYAVVRLDLATGTLRLLDSGGASPGTVAVDRNGAVYWTSPSQRAIFKLSRADAPAQRVLTGVDHPTGVAVDGSGRLYYAEVPDPGTDAAANTIWMFDGERRSLLATGQETPVDLAAGAAGDLYWSARSAGQILHRSTDGSISVLVAGLESPSGLALDEAGRRLYFTERPTPGLAGADGGRNTLSVIDLSTGERTVLRRGDLDPVDVAVAADGSLLVAEGSAGSVLNVVRHGKKSHEAEVEGHDSRPEHFFTATLSGDQEVPPVATGASGWARLDLKSPNSGGGNGGDVAGTMGVGANGERPRLQVHVTMRAISNVSSAELDLGMKGENGPMVALLLPAVQAVPGNDHQVEAVVTPDSLVGPLAGSWDAFEEALWGGGIYLNITTADHPEGEIRGQVERIGGATTNSPPDGTIVEPADNVSVALGDPVSFAGTASDPDGDMVTVLWDFGDGSSSTEASPGDHVYGEAGEYHVTFTATDSTGQSDPTPDSRTITVEAAGNAAPEGTIMEPAGDLTVKPGHSVRFAAAAADPDGDPVQVRWDFGDGGGATGLTPGAHTFRGPGVYSVTLTAVDRKGLVDPTPDTRTITVTTGGDDGGGNGGGHGGGNGGGHGHH